MVSTEATAGAIGQPASEGGDGDKKEPGPLLTSAEQCLAALKNRIKTIHGVSMILNAFLF